MWYLASDTKRKVYRHFFHPGRTENWAGNSGENIMKEDAAAHNETFLHRKLLSSFQESLYLNMYVCMFQCWLPLSCKLMCSSPCTDWLIILIYDSNILQLISFNLKLCFSFTKWNLESKKVEQLSVTDFNRTHLAYLLLLFIIYFSSSSVIDGRI